MSRRNILLAVSGLSPQIITETLYGLAVSPAEESDRFIPDEVHVVTTAQGANRIKLLLLSEHQGWFHRMRDEFQLPSMRFDDSTIHIITDLLDQPLVDIRDANDNTRVADKLTELVAAFTNDSNTALHVSIAGGRKTMGFFAGYVLSLFARPQDSLSHVLVSPQYESHPDFFYPTSQQNIILGRDKVCTPLDTKQAKVELAFLPIVSLRDGLPERVLSGEASYSDAVAEARRAVGPPRIDIDMKAKSLLCAEIEVKMTPRDFAFYLWFIQTRLGENPNIRPDPNDSANFCAHEYLTVCKYTMSEMDGQLERIQTALTTGMSADHFRQRRSTTNKALVKALGSRLAKAYLIGSFGPNNKKYYALTVPPAAINLHNDP